MMQMTQDASSASGRYDAIVIGGGTNGLACAAHLGKSGVRTLLIEQRDRVGGCAAEGEVAPGFRLPTLAHATGPVRSDVVEELQLYVHGLEFSDTPISLSALSPDGRALVVWEEPRRTAAGLRAWSANDAAAWPAFHSSLQRIGALIAGLFIAPPPSVDAPTTRDAFELLQTLRTFRSLPKADQWRLLRWGPMAVARWPLPISSARPSNTNCCARRSPPMACSARCSGRGPPAAACSCC
jgi:phytoene dehydrogenase-like protein